MGKSYKQTIYKRENTQVQLIHRRKAIQPEKVIKKKNRITEYSFLLIKLVKYGKIVPAATEVN